MLLHGNGQILFLAEICSHFSDSFPSHGTLRDLTFKYMKDSAYTSKFDASTDSCFLIVFMENLKEGSLSLTENLGPQRIWSMESKVQTLPECVCIVDALPCREEWIQRKARRFCKIHGLKGVLLSSSSCCSGGV